LLRVFDDARRTSYGLRGFMQDKIAGFLVTFAVS